MIPQIDAFPDIPEINASQEGLDEVKQEIIDLDELVNDEAFDEELDELDELEDNEMVIDETNSQFSSFVQIHLSQVLSLSDFELKSFSNNAPAPTV